MRTAAPRQPWGCAAAPGALVGFAMATHLNGPSFTVPAVIVGLSSGLAIWGVWRFRDRFWEWVIRLVDILF